MQGVPEPSCQSSGALFPSMPIVVGVPRSGTTLLRLLLDSHPDLSIPPETGFLPWLAGPEAPRNARTFVDGIEGFPESAPGWQDFGLDARELLVAVDRIRPFAVADAVRCFYRAYATRHGKPRWGDKTPGYLHAMPAIATLLPEARFLHVVRDPRDVAVSWRRMWFAPSRDLSVLAAEWGRAVEAVRASQSIGLPVAEVRFEDLVTAPRATLTTVAAALDLPFHEAMLDHHRGAAARIAEHRGRFRADGTVLLSEEDRHAQQASSVRPPDPGKIGTFRTLLTPDEARAVERSAGPRFLELGYEPFRES